LSGGKKRAVEKGRKPSIPKPPLGGGGGAPPLLERKKRTRKIAMDVERPSE